MALKYRPQTLDKVIGQDMVVGILKSAIKKQKLSNAIILTGIRGTGKTSLARIIAKAVNCTSDETKPCLKCNSCKSLDKNNIDIVEIDAASNTGVDDIRSVIESSRYKPMISQYKVFIIDEIHMLSKNAFNAILKTLEEPPAHVKFIFATTEINKVPDTVISRCLRLDLRRVNNVELIQYLANISNLEKINIDSDVLQLIVSAAEGSVRDALSLLDQVFYLEQPIKGADVASLLGIVGNSVLIKLLEYILKGNTIEAINTVRTIYAKCGFVDSIFTGLLELLHFMMCEKASVTNISDYSIQEEIKEQLRGLSLHVTIPSINQIWQVLINGIRESNLSIDHLVTLEMTVIKICYLSDLPDLAQFLKKMDVMDNQRIESIEDILSVCSHDLILTNFIKQNVKFEIRINKEIYLRSSEAFPEKLRISLEDLLPNYSIKWNSSHTSEDLTNEENLISKALDLFPGTVTE